MITEKDAERYYDRPVAVRCADGRTLRGIYKTWDDYIDNDSPEAMCLKPLDWPEDIGNGLVAIPASGIEEVMGI